MAFPPDPDLAPIRPYAGSPDDPARPRSAEPEPRKRPRIEPADPRLWSVAVALKHPLLVDGVLIDRITVRRLTGRDVADLVIEDDDETSLNARARALMCGVHPDVLEALEASDAQEVAAACIPFLPPLLVDVEARIAAAVEPSAGAD